MNDKISYLSSFLPLFSLLRYSCLFSEDKTQLLLFKSWDTNGDGVLTGYEVKSTSSRNLKMNYYPSLDINHNVVYDFPPPISPTSSNNNNNNNNNNDNNNKNNNKIITK